MAQNIPAGSDADSTPASGEGDDSDQVLFSLPAETPGDGDAPEIRAAQAAAGYRLLGTRQVYRNPWTAVREDVFLRPDGRKGLYGTVERGTFSVIMPQHRDGRITLVRQFRYPVAKRLWEFPMGMWEERSDVDPAELALGELREETGLRAGRLIAAGMLYQGAGYSTQKGYVYLARDLERGDTARESSEADMTAHDVTLEQFERMIAEGEITCMVTLAAFALIRARGLL
ncbi:NUDIX domain-containing protein [Oecophyllibacter saccharovorans]|uniref:NUDIX domain-containing protein n=1 Tax=Oecophyllibacter saccharovorans TaxID=2558360 RepID=UPI0011691961|nr:NUDIX hydrolase [Oecophyllibacter saccharovorans]TPW35111.1 NUDIX hydrolase [Oecophyllibacter saccharovorans]